MTIKETLGSALLVAYDVISYTIIVGHSINFQGMTELGRPDQACFKTKLRFEMYITFWLTLSVNSASTY